jgi:two-component system, chemotaxis family, protein-glutamate methylesterase/glutaminase
MTKSVASKLHTRPIKVLVIDDSALVRTLLADILSSDPDIEVVGTASDAIRGLEKIAALTPDVITLDIDMPRCDGLSMLDRLMPLWPLPVVMISALTRDGAEATLRALELGAVDFIEKPMLDMRLGMEAISDIVITKIKLAANAAARRKPDIQGFAVAPLPRAVQTRGQAALVAIGASTGGVAALNLILPALASTTAPILIAQHMPPVFTQQLAKRLDKQCNITVCEAEDGMPIRTGHAYIAPGDRHLQVRRTSAGLMCALWDGQLVNGHKPSVDVLFDSVATLLGRSALGILLTGMGRDGAAGLLNMRQAGAMTICQDEASSLVYGMPQAGKQIGAATSEAALSSVPDIISAASTTPERARASVL